MSQLLEKTTDQRTVLQGTWEHFIHLQKGYEEISRAKLSYYNGTIEILMPGRDHEIFASIIGYLVTTFLVREGIFFQQTRSMTQQKEGEVSAQADESYCIGSVKPIPDLSIEVVFTSGGESKLALYRALGVPEVWFWQDGVLRLHHLREQGYERIDRSELSGLEELDLDLLKRCIMLAETDAGEAIRTFQQEIF